MTDFISYVQRTGALRFPPSHQVPGAYSGHGAGLNNPAMEATACVGPIPAGWWRIVRWDAVHGDKGKVVAVLAPVGHDAHGRSAFLVHGDNAAANHTASDGCIIAPGESNRAAMQATGIQWVLVVHEEADLAGPHSPPVDSAALVS